MRTDPAGTKHPYYKDIHTAEDYLHIADCAQCQRDYDGPVLWHAREIKARNG